MRTGVEKTQALLDDLVPPEDDHVDCGPDRGYFNRAMSQSACYDYGRISQFGAGGWLRSSEPERRSSGDSGGSLRSTPATLFRMFVIHGVLLPLPVLPA